MIIDYNKVSNRYDLTRTANIDTIKKFFETVSVANNTKILDYGCGTGNFTGAIKMLTNANIFGVEPSEGMRKQAAEKYPDIVFKHGDQKGIPFPDDFFDFIYMTDVIHHVPDIDMMFGELKRVLKKDAFICIVTESYKQIRSRFWVKYFPAIIQAEEKRYPDIPVIIESAEKA